MSPKICLLLCGLIFLSARPVPGADTPLRQLESTTAADQAILRVRAGERAPEPIPAAITGKFAEHLGFNIYHGMDAQILFNPTFADYPFWNGQMTPDGVTAFRANENRIVDELRGLARRFGWPESELAGLVQARADALAPFWTRAGDRDDVELSPDTAASGARAQRVQVRAAGQGIAQWTWLPLHRIRRFDVRLLVRSPDLSSLTVALFARDVEKPVAAARLSGLSGAWKELSGSFTVPAELPSEDSYKLAILAEADGQFVIAHAFLLPSDQIDGADPEIVRFLKEAHLPLLRWPGGNFASTYHWADAVGPMGGRITRPNYAWGGLEPNTFGTDEFIAFCRAVGCEPMICVNAGSGTPAEAARWVEYCNGPATSPMGRWRAANGHPEPFHITRWEVGNELWGHWQMGWTTPAGYIDRYRQFAAAMLAADPSITLYACGAPAMSGKRWNDTLIAGLGSSLRRLTDHPLIGGGVAPSAEAIDVFRDFMVVPEVLQEKWAALRDAMVQGGIQDPKLAVTELQLFAHIGHSADTNAPVRLTRDHFPGQGSITEALYDILIYHAAIRLAPFVELITHSAVVNHGGGLRKEREHVWANPCYYAQAAFAAFAGATPVAVEIDSATEQAPMVLPDLRNATQSASCSAVDALAAVGRNGTLLLSIVNRRGSPDPVHLQIVLDGFRPGKTAQLRTLAAGAPWEGNTLQQPDRIKPVDSQVSVREGKLDLDLPPFSVMRLEVPGAE